MAHVVLAAWALGAAVAHPGNWSDANGSAAGASCPEAVDIAVAADDAVLPVLRALLASIELHSPRSFVHVVTTSAALEHCHGVLAGSPVPARCVEWTEDAAAAARSQVKVVSGANTPACAGLEGCDGARAQRLANVLNFARFHLAELLPQLDRVIWMDCDVIVRGPLHGVAAAASRHPGALLSAFSEPQRFGRFYLDEGAVTRLMETGFPGLRLDTEAESFNDGVISINLQRWREVDATKTFAWLMSQHHAAEPGLWKYGTQPAMMLLGVAYGWERLEGQWYHGDLGFRSAHKDDLGGAIFLHFDGEKKPWKEGGLNKELWRPYAEHADAPGRAGARDACECGRAGQGAAAVLVRARK